MMETHLSVWLLLAGMLVFLAWFHHVAHEPTGADAGMVVLAMTLWALAGKAA